jgi:hypothetical protein
MKLLTANDRMIAVMNTNPFPRSTIAGGPWPPKRGVLLLVVLSMLTLFLMLGTAYLVVSARSKETARAFAKLAMQSDTLRAPPSNVLDAAFLRIIRGGTTAAILSDASVPPPSVTPAFESLLEDKYGSSVTGTTTSVTQVPNAPLLLITAVIPGYPPATGAAGPAGLEAITDFPGRVITLLGAGREPTSHRIVRANTISGGTVALYTDVHPGKRPFRLPPNNSQCVINGAEYQIHITPNGVTTNEAWDAFDNQNVFLTHLAPGTSIASTVAQRIGLVTETSSQTLLSPGSTANQEGGGRNVVSSSSGGFAYGADNDGDGEVDGVFVDVGLPQQFNANGDRVNFDVSALIVDLDSRYNVNTHGSLAEYTYSLDRTTPHAGWVRSGTSSKRTWSGTVSTIDTVTNTPVLGIPVGADFGSMPMGSGYGPAEVNGRWLFPVSSYPSAGSKDSASPPTEMYGLLALSGIAHASQTGLRASGSRFNNGLATPRVSNLEGRYGEGRFATTASVDNLVISASTTLASGGYPLGLPGAPHVDDTLSQYNDQGVNTSLVPVPAGVGIPQSWWNGSSTYNWITTGLASSRGSYNSPPDLHGRMVTITSTTSAADVIPRLCYAKPEWGPTETQDDPYEVRLDSKAPRNAEYGTNGVAADNIFSIADLEPILRPYDRDSFQLPQRLAAIMGGVAEESKLRITTDSWDTTAITGTSASNVREWLRAAAPLGAGAVYGANSVSGVIGGEISRGERFNLNRPFTAAKPPSYDATHPYYRQRQAYFKDLYTAMVAVSGTASPPSVPTKRKYAQWAANAVEFRDADSTMTPFEFDLNPLNGWSCDGDVRTNAGETDREVVWGAERPEAIIAATSAWEDTTTGEMFVLLHRPWNSLAFARSVSGSTSTPGEPIDVELDLISSGTGTDQLNLSKKSGGNPFDHTDASIFPVWRLRIVDSAGATSYVRFDISTAPSPDQLVASSLTSEYAMATDSWQCVMGANAAGLSVPGTSNPTFNAFVPPGPRAAAGDPPGNATVYLERLTDPRATIDTAVWNAPLDDDDPATSGRPVARYRIVDRATMQIVNRTPMPPPALLNPFSITYRPDPGLWRWPDTGAVPTPDTTSLESSYFARSGGTYQPLWFPWNNRPFASSAELYLVPGSDPSLPGNGRDGLGLLQQYVSPVSPATLPAIAGGFIPNGLFDLVHVPTRFSGIHTTVSTVTGTAALDAAGIHADTLSVNQLSSFREPGRVNLNTVTGSDVWNAVVAGPLQTTSGSASPVMTRTAANLTIHPAHGMHNILALNGTATGTAPPVRDNHPLLGPMQSLNPAHNIYTATRLASTATVRSNVFGVWITVRQSVANDPDSIKLHRGFYVFDRSIPVAFDPGKDHNVWDAVLLRSIIQ